METDEKTKRQEELIKELLATIGEQPERVGLQDTPKRVAKMYKEIFRGYGPAPAVTVFPNGSDGITYDQMITDEGSYYSQCEHHMVPFFGKYVFAYIPHPKGKLLGLSKVARIVDHYSAKLQIQERLVQEIVSALWNSLDDPNQPIGMALFMRGEHLCKTMRGVKKKGSMTTTELVGAFKDDPSTKEEFLRRCVE